MFQFSVFHYYFFYFPSRQEGSLKNLLLKKNLFSVWQAGWITVHLQSLLGISPAQEAMVDMEPNISFVIYLTMKDKVATNRYVVTHIVGEYILLIFVFIHKEMLPESIFCCKSYR